MSTTFLLIRHALKEKTRGDVGITDEGKSQAQLTAAYLQQYSVTAVIASPLRRVEETAAYIATAVQSPLQKEPRLRERANWGDMPGQTFEQFVEMWERCTADRNYIPPVGDSAGQAGERLGMVLSELAEQYPVDSTIVIVTHGGLITDWLVGAIPQQQLTQWHPEFIAVQSTLIPECSITELVYDKGKYKLISFASISHLNKERIEQKGK
ncbi:histidine phosphatase family protein [Paenibacillus bovis]|uniref:Phosphoglycerate kinase n=1 Tax=Paenibacillus bovis TaxID=1616788 RepID=A0A172ZJE5_9BACL|nr:histidine phosphatase family protein [Paenibacillus bovis]ANF97397.1 phosphoglycerate kinase [Paenibacillus bovis]